MMASGRPVVATAESGTQVAEAVKECGIVVPPGDPKALVDAILKLVSDHELSDRLGAAARVHALANFGRPGILKSFEEDLVSLFASGGGK